MCASLVPSAAAPNRRPNALTTALNARDWVSARELLASPESVALCGGKSSKGTTVLMMVAMGSVPADIVDRVVAAGVGASERKWVRRAQSSGNGTKTAESGEYLTAADFADAAGDHALAERLRALEGSPAANGFSRRKGGDECCALCSERLRARSKVDVLGDLVAKGEETNPLVRALFERPTAVRGLRRSELHRATDCKHFKKELTEVMAVMEALRRVVERPGGTERLDASWHVVDLCCGRSLATALLSLLFGCPVTAVDRLEAERLPHYAEAGLSRVGYLQQDLLAAAFLPRLAAALEPRPRRVAIIGVHCCGALSEAAVAAFHALGADACVLVPCCLPAKDAAPATVYATRDQRLQYLAWAEHLRASLVAGGPAEAAAAAAVAAEGPPQGQGGGGRDAGAAAVEAACDVDGNVLSSRNAVVTACRR